MSARIDRAIDPPGRFRGATAYTLFSTARGLYLIRTGRGWRVTFEPRGRINRFFALRTVRFIQRRLDGAEARLDAHDLERELAERSGSRFIPRSTLGVVTVESNRAPELLITTGADRLRLLFEPGRAAEVEAFAESLRYS